MKKNFLGKFIVSGLCCLAASVAVSCTDDLKGNGNGGNGDNGGNGENNLVVTQTITPLRYADMKYESGVEGVSVDVTSVSPKNFIFICKPGEEVKSYRMNVYPLSAIYNVFLNALNESGKQQFTVEEDEELLKNIMENSESVTSAGVLVNQETMGDDWANFELDWMNSAYAQIDIKPDAEYIIVCQAYFDAEGKEFPGDMTICRVVTTKEEIIGSPAVELECRSGYMSFSVIHHPNDDTFGYYYLSSDAKQIDQYIDAYGDKTYRDFLRHYGELVKSPEQRVVEAKEQLVRDPLTNELIEYTATAIAVDKNGTPADEINRQDFTLKEAPENTEKAEGKVEMPHKLAATICQFKIRLEKNALRLAYYVHPKDKADALLALDSLGRKEIALLMVRGLGEETKGPGWIVVNSNYGLNIDKNELTGEGLSTEGWQHELKPDTEYRIVYAVMNGYGQADDLYATDVFRTKEFVSDRPDDSKEDVVMKITNSTRTALQLETVFNSDNTARIWWQYYYPDNPGAGYDLPDPAEIIMADEARKDEFEAWDPAGMDARLGGGKYGPKSNWYYWFFVWRDPDYGFPWPNETCDAFQSGQIKDEFYFDGFKSGKKFYFAYIAEDWNGVLGHVKFFDGSTKAIVGGDNPKVTIEHQKLDNGDIRVTYKANEDTRKIMYAIKDNSEIAPTLMLNSLVKPDFDGITYDEYVTAFKEFVLSTGLDTDDIEVNQTIEMKKNGQEKVFEIAVAMALPVGGVDAGKPVYGDLETLIYIKETGELKTLEEYMGINKE